MNGQIHPIELPELLRWWPRPEPDPALFVLLGLLRDDPRGMREVARLQLELSKEIHTARALALE